MKKVILVLIGLLSLGRVLATPMGDGIRSSTQSQPRLG